ncbi:MAG: ATP-binding cassette domain-containing protein [Paludibacteraceae bacterium]
MSVKLEHIYKTIGKQTILRDLTLEIHEGEIVGLLGPNGAGKSTLMKILTGLWQFDKGRATVCGVDMGKAPHDVASFVGYLPENNPLYDDMYVKEYLQFMADVSGKQTDVELLIDAVGLRPETGKKIGQLSKGYRQRVGLAQALSGDPKLLILDEPTTGLDPNQLDEIRALIRRLSEGRTIILSTHILQEVSLMCSHVVILSKGEIKADLQDIANVDLQEVFREATCD